jgi:hypothetical protein
MEADRSGALTAGALREQAADHQVGRLAHGPFASAGLGEGVVAQGAQGVVAATSEFSGHRKRRPVGAETVSDLEVVVVVGRAVPGRALGRLEQRPAQHRRSLASQMATGASVVRGVDGDVETGVADGVVGGREPSAIAQLGPMATEVSAPMP